MVGYSRREYASMPRERNPKEGDPGGLKCPICKQTQHVIDSRTKNNEIKPPQHYRVRECVGGHRTVWMELYIGQTKMRHAVWAARQLQKRAEAENLILSEKQREYWRRRAGLRKK